MLSCTVSHARRRQIASELYVFSFSLFSLPFALLRSRVRHGAARLSWHGVGRITCVQSLITSFRIDYYSAGLGSWRVTEEATKTPSCTAWGCCCGYINAWESVVMWSRACWLQGDKHFASAECPPACLTSLTNRYCNWAHGDTLLVSRASPQAPP